jgi:hypothetical protein
MLFAAMTDPSQLPPPDLLDSSGRLKRIVLALIIGSAAATGTYLVATSLAEPERQATTGGFKFVFYVTTLVGAVCFLVALAIQNKLADRKWRTGLVPTARVERE